MNTFVTNGRMSSVMCANHSVSIIPTNKLWIKTFLVFVLTQKNHLRVDSLVPLISLPGVSPALDKPAFYWPIIFIRMSANIVPSDQLLSGSLFLRHEIRHKRCAKFTDEPICTKALIVFLWISCFQSFWNWSCSASPWVK